MGSVHTVKLDWITEEPEKVIARHARVSTANPDREEYERLLKFCIKHSHWSVFEQANASFEIITTRAISPQILRHRTFTFQELCVAGNAKITVSTGLGNPAVKIPIEKLYEDWSKERFKSRFARSYDSSVGRFIEAPIRSVYMSGKKPVYRYTIGKRTIDCTREHRVLTKERGFVDFSEAYNHNLTVALNGVKKEPLPYQNPSILEANAWMGSTAFAEKFGIQPVTARKWFRKHGVKPYNPANAACSSIDLPFSSKKNSFMNWARKSVLKSACELCGHDGSESRLELSHIVAHDGDPTLCFDESNLQTLCAKCHRSFDIHVQGKNCGWTLAMGPKWQKIDSEEYLGVKITYDIEMDHPTHNFVADGVVVHNSQRYANPWEIMSCDPEEAVNFELRKQAEKNRQSSAEPLDLGLEAMFRDKLIKLDAQAYDLYHEMVEAGVARECARNMLPLYTPTKLHMNGTIRSWAHYVGLRGREETQKEHRQIALQIGMILAIELPVVTKALSLASETDHSLLGWQSVLPLTRDQE